MSDFLLPRQEVSELTLALRGRHLDRVPNAKIIKGDIAAVNADGTVDLLIGGTTIPSVPTMSPTFPFTVGQAVQVMVQGAAIIVMGHSGSPGMVRGATHNGNQTNHGTNPRILTIPLVIPTDWNGYGIDVWGACRITNTDTALRNFRVEISYNGSTIYPNQGQLEEVPSGDNNATEHSFAGGFNDTVTGAQNVTLALTWGATNTSLFSDNVSAFAYAWRTS